MSGALDPLRQRKRSRVPSAYMDLALLKLAPHDFGVTGMPQTLWRVAHEALLAQEDAGDVFVYPSRSGWMVYAFADATSAVGNDLTLTEWARNWGVAWGYFTP